MCGDQPMVWWMVRGGTVGVAVALVTLLFGVAVVVSLSIGALLVADVPHELLGLHLT